MKISLYVAGDAPSSRTAQQTLDELLHDLDGPQPDYEVVDVLREPARALKVGLLATPTLILEQGERSRRYVGDLSNQKELIAAIKAYRNGRSLS